MTNYDACLYNSLIQQIIKYIISHVLLVLKTETKATFYMIQLSKKKYLKFWFTVRVNQIYHIHTYFPY